MKTALKILILEDSAADVTLITKVLSEGPFQPHILHIHSIEGLEKALKEERWDIVLSNYTSPDFLGIEALRLLKSQDSDIPFIFVSNKDGEDIAVDAMRMGANDYIMKHNLKRLTPTIERELWEASVKRKHKKNQLGLIEAENNYRQLVELCPDAILVRRNDIILFLNAAALKLFKAKDASQIIGKSLLKLTHPDYQPMAKQKIQEALELDDTGLMRPFEKKIICLDGTVLDVEVTRRKIIFEGRAAVYIVMRDITLQKREIMQIKIQHQISKALSEVGSLYQISEEILILLCTELEWELGELWSIDHSSNVLRMVSAWHAGIYKETQPSDSKPVTYRRGEGFPGKIWKDKQALWISNAENREESLQLSDSKNQEFKSAVGFPIIFEDKILGVITLFSKNNQPQEAEGMAFLVDIGSQMGHFLKRKDVEKELLYLAEHDILTKLPNRIYIEEKISKSIENARRRNLKVAVFYLDLDYFKQINDSMGHTVGDALLKIIANRFTKCLRSRDAVGRLGGDEFIAVLADIANNDEIITVLQRILLRVQEPVVLNDKEFLVSVSIGVSIFPDDGSDVQTLIKNADLALYRAKTLGRNGYQFCTTEITGQEQYRMEMENNLRRAITNNELILYYQPILDLKTKKIKGMEALIRWESPEGFIPTETFIKLSEASFLITALTEWVLHAACKQVKIWQNEGLLDFTTSINISVHSLDHHLFESVTSLLAELEMPAKLLELELKESVLMKNVEDNVKLIQSFKNLGIQIAIDNFGIGYSSMNYLSQFAIDHIKIDKSFIHQIPANPDNVHIISGMIALAHSLGIKTIGEGVETSQEADFLMRQGCDEIQGYYYCPPLDGPAVTEFLRSKAS